jgi:DNA-binding LytR/AlgR family response regulator
MNILIVEDDTIQREYLKKILQEVDKDIVIYEAEGKADALKIAQKMTIELFYIDIHLKNSSGIDLATQLRGNLKYEFAWIIFLTTHQGYALQAFKEIHCYDYIEKPYDRNTVLEITRKIFNREREKSESKKKYVIFHVEPGISMKIYVEEILFVEVKIKTCIVHTKNGAFKIGGLRLKEALEIINCEHIIQCHRSYIVNINRVSGIHKFGIKSYEISFENYDEKALLSYNFKDEIMRSFRG